MYKLIMEDNKLSPEHPDSIWRLTTRQIRPILLMIHRSAKLYRRNNAIFPPFVKPAAFDVSLTNAIGELELAKKANGPSNEF